MATKVTKKSMPAVKGGKGHMVGMTHAGPQAPQAMSNGGASKGGPKFAQGGKTKMFGFTGSQPAKPC